MKTYYFWVTPKGRGAMKVAEDGRTASEAKQIVEARFPGARVMFAEGFQFGTCRIKIQQTLLFLNNEEHIEIWCLLWIMDDGRQDVDDSWCILCTGGNTWNRGGTVGG